MIGQQGDRGGVAARVEPGGDSNAVVALAIAGHHRVGHHSEGDGAEKPTGSVILLSDCQTCVRTPMAPLPYCYDEACKDV